MKIDRDETEAILGRAFANLQLVITPPRIGIEISSLQETMRRAMGPYMDVQRRIAESMRPSQAVIDAIDLSTTKWQSEMAKLQTIGVEYRNTMEPILRRIQESTARLDAWVRDNFKVMEPMLRAAQEAYAQLPRKTKEGLLALADANWYLDSEMPITLMWSLKDEIANRPIDVVDEKMAIYFRPELDRIEGDLIQRHPTRAEFISMAFTAHREGKYILSIPALLAQAEGISLDLTKRTLYDGGVSGFLAGAKLDSLEEAYRYPLRHNKSPMVGSTQKRKERPGDLNRHAVLHGESIDYGTEINGLKAISWFNYVSYVLTPRNVEEPPAVTEALDA